VKKKPNHSRRSPRNREPHLWQHSNGYWYVIHYDGVGQRRQESLKTKDDTTAEDRFYLWKQGRAKERLGEHSASLRVTLGNSTSEYLKHFALRYKASSVARYKVVLRKNIMGFLGEDLPLQSIQVSDLQDYQLYRLKQKADKRTVDYEIDVFRTFLNWCRKRSWLVENVASKEKTDRLTTSKSTGREKRIFTDKELNRLISSKSRHGHWQHYYIDNLLYYTGCRVAEVGHLAVKDVSLQEAEIHIRPKTIRVPFWNRKKRLVETRRVDWSPKSYEERIIPIDPRLLAILQEFESLRTDNIYGLYFLSERGCQITDHISRHIKALTEKKDVSVHTFRHTHISHALNRWGRIPSVVQKMVGHKKLETTQLYLHVTKEDLHREIQKTG
jgi:integrase